MQRLDILDPAEPVVVAPGEKPDDGPVIGHAGIGVPDGGGEEFEKAFGGLSAGVGDDRRDDACRGGGTNSLSPCKWL